MGQISFAIAQAARDLGVHLATGVPVAEILLGEGVRLEGGELIRAAVIVSNADPRRTLGLVDPAAVPGDYRARVDGWQLRSPVVCPTSFAPDVFDCVAEYEVLGPPDIERRIGLTGGHIFQGETMPGQMWEHRLAARTPVPGLYLCGAATHPAGSVIALNGRNAAMAVLADTAPA